MRRAVVSTRRYIEVVHDFFIMGLLVGLVGIGRIWEWGKEKVKGG